MSDGTDAVAGIEHTGPTGEHSRAADPPFRDHEILPSVSASDDRRGGPTVRWRVLRRLRRWWPTLRVVLGFALAGVALWVVYGRGGELQASYFDHLRWAWLLPAVVVEGASLVSFALMMSRLLATGGVAAPTGPMTGLSLASQAISNSFPGGAALAGVYSFRWYRRFGADDALAGWTLVGVLVGASLSLSLVAAAGVALAAEASADLGLVPVVVGVLALSVGMAVLFVKQDWLLSAMTRLVGRWRRGWRGAGRERTSDRRPDPPVRLAALFARLGAFRLGWRGLAEVTGWGLGTWLLDCACFVFAFVAVGAHIPWGALLLAYGAGQLAANLPITPGGLGVVEGSIQVALVTFGGNTNGSVEAVFVYRLISFWLELVVGWSAVGVLSIGVRRGRWERTIRRSPPLTGAGAGAAAGTGAVAVAAGGSAGDR